MADVTTALANASILLNWWHGADVPWATVEVAMDDLLDAAFDDGVVRAATFQSSELALFSTALLLEPGRIQDAVGADGAAIVGNINTTSPAPRVKMMRSITAWSRGTWRTGFEPRKEGLTAWITSRVAGDALAGTIAGDWDPNARIEALTLLNKTAYPLEWQGVILTALNKLDEVLPQLPLLQDSVELEDKTRSTIAALSRDLRGSISIQQADVALGRLPSFGARLPDGSTVTIPPPPAQSWYENRKIWVGVGGLIVGGLLASRRSR